MPVKNGIDSKGKFWQFGGQKKYYYTTPKGSAIQKAKAQAQGRAIKVSQTKIKCNCKH